ncbi:hypothetical protein EU519_01365 [Candidatus Thorarchaeota archaeon]|nr:MAG: hypothetical protein EU519_01365 [Candidatus Thorarchaeota archaeon]
MTCEITLDFRGVELFWRILHAFQSGGRPEEDTWDRLFNTPGYAALTESEFDTENLRKAISLALDPKRAYEARSSKGTRLGEFVEHFREVADRRLGIEIVMEELRNRSTRLEIAISDLVEEYLPEEAPRQDTQVALVFFELDARGYECIVVDALLAAELGDLLDLLIAHEYHHQCRDAILCYDKEAVEKEDKDLMWVLNQTHAEGIADHIDKPRWFYNRNPVEAYTEFVEQYRKEVLAAKDTLALMDDIIETGCATGESHAEIGRSIREILPLSGHPVGYFMSNSISEANLTAEMIEALGNPFKFFQLYNKAREVQGKNTFSDATIDFLEDLEKKYC